MDLLLKRALKVSLILTVIIAIGLAASGQRRFAAGILVGAAWSMVNFLLLINLLQIALLKKPDSRLTVFLLIKFPVLYLIGFLILSRKFFPSLSLLLGLSLVLLVAGALNLWPKRI